MKGRRWRPSLFLVFSAVLHGIAVSWTLLDWQVWPWSLGLLVINHLCIAAAGLWPKSRLLGPNLLRLPEDAARRGEVAITIDDGPDPDVTPKVLAILAEYGAQASFFCIGERAAAHPELIRSIVLAGHRVENHGQRHRNYNSLLGLRGWAHEVGDAQTTLAALAGRPPCYFRALAGLRNPFLEPVLCRFGLSLATWTWRGYDTRTREPDLVFVRLTRELAAGDILLLHDGHAARTQEGSPIILTVLPRLLGLLASRGLVAAALPPVLR
jgi:peptidoglycan-N-acetylglucosamine deacetylase